MYRSRVIARRGVATARARVAGQPRGRRSNSAADSSDDDSMGATAAFGNTIPPPLDADALTKVQTTLTKSSVAQFSEPTADRTFRDFVGDIEAEIGSMGFEEKFTAKQMSAEESKVWYWYLAKKVAGKSRSALNDARKHDFFSAWEKVNARWNPKRLFNKYNTIKNLTNGRKCARVEDFEDFMLKRVELKEKLEQLPEAEAVTAEDLLCCGVLEGLPEELKGIADRVEMCTEGKFRWEDLKILIQDNISKLNTEEKIDDKATAMYTSGKNDAKCLYCGRAGHWAADCKTRMQHQKTSQAQSIKGKGRDAGRDKNTGKNGPGRKCFRCKSTKHIAKDCPQAPTAHHTEGVEK